MTSDPRPYNLIAELTYRCPLQCPYCSNPTDFGNTLNRELTADEWARVFREAAGLGVMQVGLTGGEPGARPDLKRIVEKAAEAGLYPHLVTAGTVFSREKLAALQSAGLISVQLSVQDAAAEGSDAIAGVPSYARKLDFARWAQELGIPLILNVVLHRHNLGHVQEIVELAVRVGAHRLELANTQYYGWALTNRAALLPTPAQLEAARSTVESARKQYPALELLFVLPDYFAEYPKPCMGGWGSQSLLVNPTGDVLPCHAAHGIPGLHFENVRDKPLRAIWLDSTSFNKFRGTDWMREPCRSCERKEVDFGGCRCQALLLTGDAANADPVCHLSPHHQIVAAAQEEGLRPSPAFRFRTLPASLNQASR